MENLPRKSLQSLPEYIPGKQVDEVVKEYKIENVIKLASNENPFGPSPKALEAIKKNLTSLNIYPDQHHHILREALSQKYSLTKENFIIGNGSDEIMLMIAQTFLSFGDEVIISSHTFSMYEFVTKLMDGVAIVADLKNFSYDLEAMQSKISKKTKLIFLCNPNNPTGTIFTSDQFEKFMRNVPEDVLVIVDEAYSEFVDSSDFANTIDYVKRGRNVIVLKTFSKAYGLAGLRIGYAISTPKIIKTLNLVKMPFNVNRLAIFGAVEALKDIDFLEKVLKNNIEGKEYLYRELQKLKLQFLKTQANFIFIDVQRDCDEVFIELIRRGVIIRPLKTFGFPKAIRVSIGKKEQNEKFISSLKDCF